MVRRAGVAVSAIAFVAVACKPSLNDTQSIVTNARVLAVRADPAESAPKTPIAFSALVVDATGTLRDAPIDWAFCNQRKPLAELGPVSPLCMTRDDDFLTELGVGAGVTTTLAETACKEFGPDVPEVKMGEPAGRPVDPDPTGGYYQPLRLALPGSGVDAFTLERARIACGIVGATSQQLVDFRTRYRPNANPSVDALTADGAPLVVEGSGAPGVVAAGARVTLRASWATCTDPTKDCGGAEPYVVFDLASRSIVDRREAFRVSWFATAGSFDHDHTGRDADEIDPFSENAWTAPMQGGTVHVWIVLRDERGGSGWKGFVVDVR